MIEHQDKKPGERALINYSNDSITTTLMAELNALREMFEQETDSNQQHQKIQLCIEHIQSQKIISLDLLNQSLKLILKILSTQEQCYFDLINMQNWIVLIRYIRSVFRKYICSTDCIALFLEFYLLYQQHTHSELILPNEIELLTEFAINFMHIEDIYVKNCQAISQVIKKSDKWHSLMEYLCQTLAAKGKDVKQLERTLYLFNLTYIRNPCLQLIKKFNIHECINHLIYHFIDNLNICIQISKLYLIISFAHTQEQQEIIQKFNLIISLLIQHIDNDLLVLNVVKIFGCCMQQKKNYSSFVNMELLRFFADWSKTLVKLSMLTQKQKLTVQIILHMTRGMIQENQNSEQLIEQSIISLLLNILQKFKDDSKICNQCFDIIGYLSIHKRVSDELFLQDAFPIINQVFVIQIYNKDTSQAVISIINSIVANNMEKIDLIILQQFNNSLALLLQVVKCQIEQQPQPKIDILKEILQYISLVSIDSIKCQILWNTDCIEYLFCFIVSDYNQSTSLVEHLINIFSIYSQMPQPQQFLLKHRKSLLKLIALHVFVYEICDDFISILVNFVNNEQINVFTIIDDFVPSTLEIIRSQPEQQSLVLRLFDLYEQISKYNLQTRLKIQDMCQSVIQEFETNKIIHPYLNTLNEYIGRQSISYLNLLSKEARDYLVNGIDCKLYKDDGSISNLLVFVTPDLASIWCKHHGDQLTKQKWRLATKHVIALKDYLNDVDGWRQSPFKRFGKKSNAIEKMQNLTSIVVSQSQGIQQSINRFSSNIFIFVPLHSKRRTKCLNI